jgi:hypothetical protein
MVDFGLADEKRPRQGTDRGEDEANDRGAGRGDHWMPCRGQAQNAGDEDHDQSDDTAVRGKAVVQGARQNDECSGSQTRPRDGSRRRV